MIYGVGRIAVIGAARCAGAEIPEREAFFIDVTYATLALQAGVPVKVVSERLGHATIAQTMDTYAHVLPKDDDLAAELFERHLYAS